MPGVSANDRKRCKQKITSFGTLNRRSLVSCFSGADARCDGASRLGELL